MDAIANHDDPALAAERSAELTLEAALAFIDGCTIDSDEEAAADPTRQRQQSRSRTASHRSSAATVASSPPSPRFFEFVDAVADESDSEYVSMGDALKMLDTCEIDAEATEGGGSTGVQKPSTKSSVVRQLQQTKETQQKLSFTQMARAVSPSGSSDNDGNSDASGAGSSARSASSVKSTAGGARKPKQRATTAPAVSKTSKKREAGARTSAKLRNAVKEPPAEVAAGTDAVTTETTVKPKKKRVRKQRQELLYLREKVVEMQQVLESLQKGDDRTSETTSSTSSPTTAVSSPTSSFDPEAATQQQQQNLSFSPNKRNSADIQIDSAAWEALAEQQLRERERAEQENRQLKATLEGQIKLVRSLERLLIGPNDIELPGSTSQAKRVKMHLDDTREDDLALLLELKYELASSYPRFEKDFASSYLRDLTGDGSDIQVKTTAERGMHVEFTASKVVQHSFGITRRGVWRFMSRDGMKNQCYFYKELEEPTNNFIARDFGFKLERSHRDMDIHGTQVLKKIEQERRDVFLWTAVVQPVKFSDAPSMKGIRFRERGWLVMQPAQDSDGNPSENATIIKTFVTFTPDLDENMSAKSMAVGAITDLVIDSVEGNMHFCQDMVDQLVLEEEWRPNNGGTIVV